VGWTTAYEGFSQPQKLINHPWSSQSQIVDKPSHSNKNIYNNNQYRHPFRDPYTNFKSNHYNKLFTSTQRSNYISGIRHNPQRMSYINEKKYKNYVLHRHANINNSHKVSGGTSSHLEKLLSRPIHPKFMKPIQKPAQFQHNNSSNDDYFIQRIPTNDSRLTNGKGYMTVISSPNDILRLEPEEKKKDTWDEKLDPNVCRKMRGLTKTQLELCRQ